jgi:serine/threonine protein kinase
VPSIDRNDLIDAGDGVKSHFAKGVFGYCKLKMYQGHLVISKEFKTGVSKIDVMKEAHVLQGLSHPGLPIVLGADLLKEPYIIVTLFYGIDKSKTTLQRVLDKKKEAMKLNKRQSLLIIKKLCETLMFLHSHSILHSDIKGDNIVLYKDEEGLKPV